MVSKNKKAIIISLKKDNQELKELAKSLGYEIIKVFYQNREKPDVNSYVGRGKLEEIKKFIDNSEESIKLAIVNSKFKPSQWFHLEKKLKIEVYDRVRLILDIFNKRADRKEARLQVKLAQLQYERPYVKEIIHRARSGEHPGFMAGGEYQVDDYYEMIQKQMKKIRDELESIRQEREIRRTHRYKGGFYLVSLAGYTNAGKSSLLNLLSKGEVKVEGRLFSTLSTTTRKVKNKSIPILLTDTVGFIENLPAFVIDAFHSTLEEIAVSDVVILIADSSENKSEISRKLKVSIDELVELGVSSPVVVVLNKIDLISDKKLDEIVDYLYKTNLVNDKIIVPISVKNNENIDDLLEAINDVLPNLMNFKLRLPINEDSQSFISWIYDKANVFDVNYDNNFVTLSIECNSEIYNKIESKAKNIKKSTIF